MLEVLPAAERFHTRLSWLDSRHSFSFAEHFDPTRLGFSVLRVLNDDRVVPGAGFPTHPHRDAEIVTLVLRGALEHRDSMGHGSVIRAGDVQRMSAGTGVTHSEVNPSRSEPLRLLQIWLRPDRRGHEPGYEQKAFPREARRGRLVRVVDGQGRDGAVSVHADASLWLGVLGPGDEVVHRLAPGRRAWIQVATGRVRAGDATLGEGDGAAVSDLEELRLAGDAPESDVLVFDLP